MAQILDAGAIADLLKKRKPTYEDLLEPDEQGGLRIRAGADLSGVEAVEVQGDRLVSIKLFKQRARRLVGRSSQKNSSGKKQFTNS